MISGDEGRDQGPGLLVPALSMSVGVAPMSSLLFATHPLDSRIDSGRYALALLRQSGFLLVVNSGFREDFFSPTLGY